jgi:hypothetical protein
VTRTEILDGEQYVIGEWVRKVIGPQGTLVGAVLMQGLGMNRKRTLVGNKNDARTNSLTAGAGGNRDAVAFRNNCVVMTCPSFGRSSMKSPAVRSESEHNLMVLWSLATATAPQNSQRRKRRRHHVPYLWAALKGPLWDAKGQVNSGLRSACAGNWRSVPRPYLHELRVLIHVMCGRKPGRWKRALFTTILTLLLVARMVAILVAPSERPAARSGVSPSHAPRAISGSVLVHRLLRKGYGVRTAGTR